MEGERNDYKFSFQSFAPTPVRKFSLGPELLIQKRHNCDLEEINMDLLKSLDLCEEWNIVFLKLAV